MECLASDELFMSAQHMRDQCYQACRMWHAKHRFAGPYYLAAKVAGITKTTVCWHCKQNRANLISPVSNVRTPILSHAESDDLADNDENQRPDGINRSQDNGS
jgi:hypothetical protein